MRYTGASNETARCSLRARSLATERYRSLPTSSTASRDLAIKRSSVSSGLRCSGTLGYYGAYVIVLELR